MKKYILTLLLFSIVTSVKAITCANASENEVWNVCIPAAAVDEVVNIPATATPVHWSLAHILGKAVKIVGAGINQTTIINDLKGAPLVRIDLVTGKTTTISGLTFTNGLSDGSGAINTGGLIRVIGTQVVNDGSQFRMHHCSFNNIIDYPFFQSQAIGVLDHCVFTNCTHIGYNYALKWAGDVQNIGNGSWASPSFFGTFKNFYYEDNVFSGFKLTAFDGTRGGRLVVRHNTFTPAAGNGQALVTCHGMEGRNRSIRLLEYYDNIFTVVNALPLLNQRGGTGVMFNNLALSGTNGTPVVELTSDRHGNTGYYGQANGMNSWDENYPNGGTSDNPVPFFEATNPSGAGSGHNKVVFANPPTPGGTPWVPNHWIGYSVVDKSQPVSTGTDPVEQQYEGGLIIANDGNSVTTLESVFDNNLHQFFGDNEHYQFYRVKYSMDSAGRAGVSESSRVTGSPAVQPDGWNNQVVEPFFEWNNRRTDRAGALGDADFRVGEKYLYDKDSVTVSALFKDDTIMTVAAGAREDYPWDATATAIIGASGMNAYTSQATINCPGHAFCSQLQYPGDGGAPYPHPLTQETSPPTFTSNDNKTFVVNVAGTFDVTTSANPVASLSRTGSLPSGVTFTTPATQDGTATIAGTPTATGSFVSTITANNGIGTPATQTFTLTVSAANVVPTVDTFTALPLTGNAPLNVVLTATASDTDAGDSISQIEFLRGGTTINTDTTSPFTYTDSARPAGTYSYTARATDTHSGVSATPAPISVVVSGAPVTPTPAKIILKP